MKGTYGRGARRALGGIVAGLLALGAAATGAAGVVGTPAPPPPDVALPTWQSTYSWSAGDGYFGWHRHLLTADGEAYGLDTALGGRPGLWLWPQGGREYGPGGAEWVLRAQEPPRIARARVSVPYPNSLFPHHCLRIGLRSDDESRDGVVFCKPPSPPASQDDYQLQLADPSGRPTA